MSNCNSKYLYKGDISTLLRNLLNYHSEHNTFKKLLLNDIRYLLNIHNSYKSQKSHKTKSQKSHKTKSQKIIKKSQKSLKSQKEVFKVYNRCYSKQLKKNKIRKKIRNKIVEILCRRL